MKLNKDELKDLLFLLTQNYLLGPNYWTMIDSRIMNHEFRDTEGLVHLSDDQITHLLGVLVKLDTEGEHHNDVTVVTYNFQFKPNRKVTKYSINMSLMHGFNPENGLEIKF